MPAEEQRHVALGLGHASEIAQFLEPGHGVAQQPERVLSSAHSGSPPVQLAAAKTKARL